MLTKEIMQKMKEGELSQQVLIPLLRKMGFQDVFYFHGGAGEQGKDVVFWKQDELQTRKNYALVVKANIISGQAKSGKGTAGEVATQIQQVFGSEYADPVTSELQIVHECWVVTNQRILKDATTSIRSVVRTSNLDRHVQFINGDKLWELVEKHLPSQTLMGKFQMIQKELGGIDAHYQPVVQVSGDEMNLTLKEKYRGAADEKPLKFNFSFQFPDTSAGNAAKEAFEHHLATGAPVSISPEFIKSIDYPEVMRSLFATDDISQTTLEISPLSNGHHFVARIEVECDDGDSLIIDHVDFLVKQSGTEEATLENVELASLLKIKIVANLADSSAKLTFGWQLTNSSYSCTQLRQITEFQNCFSKPFKFRLLSKDLGIQVFMQRSEQGLVNSPPKFHISMLRALAKLQQKSLVPIMVPIRELTDDEIKALSRLIHIVLDGRITGKWTEFKLMVQDFSLNALDDLKKQPNFIAVGGSEVEKIFGVEVPLGDAECVFRNGLISNMDEIREAYNTGKKEIELHIVAKDGAAEFEKTYHDFISATVN